MRRKYDFRGRVRSDGLLKDAIEDLARVDIRPLPDRTTARKDVVALARAASGLLVKTNKGKLYATSYDNKAVDRPRHGVRWLKNDIDALVQVGALPKASAVLICEWLGKVAEWNARQSEAWKLLHRDDDGVLKLTKAQRKRLEAIDNEACP